MTLAEDLLARLDIVDVVGRHVSLAKAGSNYKGLCPFHGEKTPSFMVSPSKQIFKCFGCGVGGDAITFIKEIENLDFMDAARALAPDAGLDIADYERNYNPEVKKTKDSLYDINRLAAGYCRDQLQQSEAASEYVHNRGLTRDLLQHFGVGYAPDHYYRMTQWLQSQGVEPTKQLQGALAKTSQRGDQYAFFRDRIMFPIYDVQSRVVAFGGRALGADTEPKYVNSSDTPIYDKSSTLYGLNRAKNHIRTHHKLIVVEGYMDVIALHRLGCPVGIATCGTSLTIDHIRTIQKYTDTVVFLFDADKAGIQATQRALGLAYTLDLYPQIAQLPKDYKDVDDLAQAIDKDSSISRDIDAHTQDGLLVVIQRMMADIDASSPIAKQRVLRTLFELVAQVRSLSIQQHYLTMIAQQLGMSDVIILAEYQTYAREARRRQPRTSRTSTDVQTEKPYTLSEADLLAALMLDQWIATQLSDVPDTAHLMTRSQYIADHDPDSLLGQVLSDNIDQSQRDHLIQLQLRRENERSTADNHADRLALITRRLRTYIQQRTQQIVKRMPTDAKLPMIQLMQQIVRG